MATANIETTDMPQAVCPNCGIIIHWFEHEEERDDNGFPIQRCSACEAEIYWD